MGSNSMTKRVSIVCLFSFNGDHSFDFRDDGDDDDDHANQEMHNRAKLQLDR